MADGSQPNAPGIPAYNRTGITKTHDSGHGGAHHLTGYGLLQRPVFHIGGRRRTRSEIAGNGRQRNVADMGITPATEEGHMIINGQPEDIATPLSVDELIARKGLNAGRVAVEVNGAIVPRDKRAQTMLSGTDTVEIVTFVQGG